MKTNATRSPALVPKKRCAIYTRKSTDEGLDQEYNSLEAQRDSALAFISSQRHEGWIAVNDGYDDGGFSGGNTNRPALKRLLAETSQQVLEIGLSENGAAVRLEGAAVYMRLVVGEFPDYKAVIPKGSCREGIIA